ncbi:MAG: hypothetical protein ONA90_06275, partial [candidate division KSB1 bacterium]|nr:hypothetical protein [candidate division KSB1 bacterium]
MKFWQGFVLGVLVTLVIGATFLPSIISESHARQEVFYQGKTVFVKSPEENLRAAPSGDKLGLLYKVTSMV